MGSERPSQVLPAAATGDPQASVLSQLHLVAVPDQKRKGDANEANLVCKLCRAYVLLMMIQWLSCQHQTVAIADLLDIVSVSSLYENVPLQVQEVYGRTGH